MKTAAEVEFDGAEIEYRLALEECAWALREMLAVGGLKERGWAMAAAGRMDLARIELRRAGSAFTAEIKATADTMLPAEV